MTNNPSFTAKPTPTYLGPASKHNHTHQLLLNDTEKVIITHDIIFQESIMPAQGVATASAPLPVHSNQQLVKPAKVTPYKVPPTTTGICTAKRTGRSHVSPSIGAINASHTIPALHDNAASTSRTTLLEQRTDALHKPNHSDKTINLSSMPSLYNPNLHWSPITGLRGDIKVNPTLNASHRSQQTHVPNVQLHELTSVASKSPKTPNSYKEALASPDANHWQKAMEEEIQAIMHNRTFTLVPLPQGHKPIGAHWLYKVKLHADSTINCFKARWVAKGFTQHFRINYNSTFSPVICIKNLRLLLAFANACNLKIHQVNVNTAFLHTKLTEEIYISQLEGFINQQQPNHVGQLLKSLYRLKQAPLKWNKAINAHLCKSNFEPTDLDPCIYICHSHHLAIITLYINNCTIITHQSELRGVKQLIANGFPIKDLSEATLVLSIEIHCDCCAGKLYI
jgi:hypothetical protein